MLCEDQCGEWGSPFITPRLFRIQLQGNQWQCMGAYDSTVSPYRFGLKNIGGPPPLGASYPPLRGVLAPMGGVGTYLFRKQGASRVDCT